MTTQKIIGNCQNERLDQFRPNPWNPNRMTEFERESLEAGLKSDGWIASQALLVWSTDAAGERRDLIIDGEHRWRAATGLGLIEGPIVRLEGLSENDAKKLTIKLNSKRGTFKRESLEALVREIQFALGSEDLGLDLGIERESLMQMLAVAPLEIQADESSIAAAAPVFALGEDHQSTRPAVVNVQLFFDVPEHAEFRALIAGRPVPETILSALKIVAGDA